MLKESSTFISAGATVGFGVETGVCFGTGASLTVTDCGGREQAQLKSKIIQIKR
jgi:uncharacterized protein YxjI